MSRLPIACLSLSAALVAACGPATGEDGDSGGSGGSGSTTAASTGGPSCEMYIGDDDIGPAVDVTVRNATDAPLWLYPSGGCGGSLAISVTPEGGTDPLTIWAGECSPILCEGLMASQDCYLGCPDCAPPSFGRMDAGVVDATPSWSGVSHATLEMTAACAPGLECQRPCYRPDQAPAGSYVIQAVGYRACSGGPCECEGPNPGGTCYGWSPATLTDPVMASALIDYPGTTSVELVFE